MLYSYFIKTRDLTDAIACSDDGLLFNKELIYVGQFSKGEHEFNITEADIDNWVSEYAVMSAYGFRVKLPVEHTFDPEKTRGDVVGLFKARDSKNRIALFGQLRFVDSDAAKLARTTDVSIFSPPVYQMGNGYVAKRPITHVALTDYPVVPGLDGFETLAASLHEGTHMIMAELAKMLGIEIPAEVTDDAAIAELIAGEFGKLKDAAKPADEKPADEPKPDDAMAASMVKLMTNLRLSQIDGLVHAEKLTPAEAKEWKKAYAETVSLSNTDGFDKAYELASKRTSLNLTGEKTKRQASGDVDNALIADAKRRKGA